MVLTAVTVYLLPSQLATYSESPTPARAHQICTNMFVTLLRMLLERAICHSMHMCYASLKRNLYSVVQQSTLLSTIRSGGSVHRHERIASSSNAVKCSTDPRSLFHVICTVQAEIDVRKSSTGSVYSRLTLKGSCQQSLWSQILALIDAPKLDRVLRAVMSRAAPLPQASVAGRSLTTSGNLSMHL